MIVRGDNNKIDCSDPNCRIDKIKIRGSNNIVKLNNNCTNVHKDISGNNNIVNSSNNINYTTTRRNEHTNINQTTNNRINNFNQGLDFLNMLGLNYINIFSNGFNDGNNIIIRYTNNNMNNNRNNNMYYYNNINNRNYYMNNIMSNNNTNNNNNNNNYNNVYSNRNNNNANIRIYTNTNNININGIMNNNYRNNNNNNINIHYNNINSNNNINNNNRTNNSNSNNRPNLREIRNSIMASINENNLSDFEKKKLELILEMDEYQYKHIQKYESRKETKCAICLEEFKGPDIIKAFYKCEHIFHKKCLLDWLKNKNKCPLCNHDLSDDIKKMK